MNDVDEFNTTNKLFNSFNISPIGFILKKSGRQSSRMVNTKLNK